MRTDAQHKRSVQSDLRLWHDVVKGREPPAVGPVQEAVVAQVIVVIGDEDVEDHTPEEFQEVRARL